MKKYIGTLIFAALLVVILHKPIMRGLGNFLISADDVPADIPALFVLSGGAFDRGKEAARLYDSITVHQIYCTGSNGSGDLRVFFGDSLAESAITRVRMVQLGVPDSIIHIIREGTSTLEESDVILKFCLENELRECVVLSNSFHTRRVQDVFQKKFKRNGIALTILGAPSAAYDEKQWWKSEYGLLAVNNEYVKLLYYLFKQ